MKRTPKARILVIEDDPSILYGLLDVLVFNGYEATGKEDGAEGLTCALEQNFDLIILDLMLPSLEGIPICKQIREQKPGQGIIMLTAKGAEEDVIEGFRAGTDDYVCKPFSLRELMVRIEAVLRRLGKSTGDEEVRVCDVVFSGKTLRASYNDISMELTRREMDIILYLQRNRDRIVSKKELLSEVWNYQDPEIETRTVDIHILKLRKKLASLRSDVSLSNLPVQSKLPNLLQKSRFLLSCKMGYRPSLTPLHNLFFQLSLTIYRWRSGPCNLLPSTIRKSCCFAGSLLISRSTGRGLCSWCESF